VKQLAEIAKIDTKLDLIETVGIGISIAPQQFGHPGSWPKGMGLLLSFSARRKTANKFKGLTY
jgi:hypothetical protein